MERTTEELETQQVPQGSRVRSLTPKASELYDDKVIEHLAKLEKSWVQVDERIEEINASLNDPNALKTLETALEMCVARYNALVTDYHDFLTRTNTQESIQEKERSVKAKQACQLVVTNARKHLDTRLEQLLSEQRHTSCSSKRSSRYSSASSAAARMKAKAEAARARAEFAEKESEIRKQKALLEQQYTVDTAKTKATADRKKAELDADLDVLAHKKEAAAAEAEAEALLASETSGSRLTSSDLSSLGPPVNSVTRTKEYVEKHSQVNALVHVPDEYKQEETSYPAASTSYPAASTSFPAASTSYPAASTSFPAASTSYAAAQTSFPAALTSYPAAQNSFPMTQTSFPTTQTSFPMTQTSFPPQATDTVQEEMYMDRTDTAEPTLQSQIPRYHAPTGETHDSSRHLSRPTERSVATDMTNFLLKKDLLLCRLTNFNDKPEFYDTWKSSFRAVMDELQVTPLEEMDLLLKWSGPESRKYVLSIKAANSSNPKRGLLRIWERLQERYGCPEMVESALKQKLNGFPKLSNKDNKRLYDLSDILSEIQSVKEDTRFSSLLAYYDASTGINPIVNKLPPSMQEKWTATAVRYMKTHRVSYPPFSVFTDFMKEQSSIRNNPSFMFENHSGQNPGIKKDRNPQRLPERQVAVNKTDYENETPRESKRERCPLHNTRHSVNECKAFARKPLGERFEILKEKRCCFRCCQYKHRQKSCKVAVKCDICLSHEHPSALHPNTDTHNKSPLDGGERNDNNASSQAKVNSACSQICGDGFGGKSCAKMVLVDVYPSDQPEKAARLYAILDDQSNRSLAKSELFDMLGLHGERTSYLLSTCNGKIRTAGRKASGLTVQSMDGNVKLHLPTLIECETIPDVREEIPTPAVAVHHPHLRDIASHIPPIDNDANIVLLIGRDLIDAHHVLDQRIGPPMSPYAQKLPLGWTVTGEACLGGAHVPEQINVNKTHVLRNGRVSLLEPCSSEIHVRENPLGTVNLESRPEDRIGEEVFRRTKEDEKPGLSIQDREFIDIMDTELKQDDSGSWEAPLPFKAVRQRLPDNRAQAEKRAHVLDRNLKKDPRKAEHFTTFMKAILDSGHAEVAPELKDGDEHWYLPIFGVYHPRKPDQLRAVFDSSAKCKGVSLNDVLLSGPDLTNSLLGILLRFRRESVAIMGDIRQMFYCFKVKEEDRNFLRFLWYRDNDIKQDLIEYRMCVHVFGNSPSPAVATYGLRRAARNSEAMFGSDVTQFIENDFYVDDGLTCLSTAADAIDLMKRTQDALMSQGNIYLHKIASNSTEVMEAFQTEELAKGLKDLNLQQDDLPTQRSLGLSWNLETDTFHFEVDSSERACTRRGILSTVNSVFDPLGFLAPVVIQGKLILRSLINSNSDWDEPIPADLTVDWNQWRESLSDLRDLKISRTFVPKSLTSCKDQIVHIFSDASEKAIAAVGYIETIDMENNHDMGFVLGKSKVAPSHGHTVPRLELCAAVLAVELCQTISDQLHIPVENFKFYSDSRVVLGYIYNDTRRFHTYVANRVMRIRTVTKPQQWSYVSTNRNPADKATRGIHASEIGNSDWLAGPTHLPQSEERNTFEVLDAQNDKEVRQKVCTLKTERAAVLSLGSQRFERFSNWQTLVMAVCRLQHVVHTFKGHNECSGWHWCPNSKTVESHIQAELEVIRCVQQEIFEEEVRCLKEGKRLPRNSAILSLNPFIDRDGVLRVGGRLTNSNLRKAEKNPIIIPGKHHIATLLVRHFHEKTRHQGRHFTAGAVRMAGYWITGAKRLVSTILHRCVKCRKLRGNTQFQKMADLPEDRLQPGPPFTSVGIDTFGPWSVVSRRTRGGSAHAKRWAIIFTCLTTRGVHIEVVEELSSSSFINAFRRFVAIRGSVKLIRSDRGTNFVGATESLRADAINVEDGPVREHLYNSGTVWQFNSPHSSHMGGVWERMIGITRRILDSMMSEVSESSLTHEVLTTFFAEVSAVINSRPLTDVSTDPEDPYPLTPSMLITQRPDVVAENEDSFDRKDMFKAQWRRVQHLANTFWKRWRVQYIQNLQSRRKWVDDRDNLAQGDVVLMRDQQVVRNQWPMGRVTKVFPSSDRRVRKVEVRIVRGDGKPTTFVRPVTEMVLLMSSDA